MKGGKVSYRGAVIFAEIGVAGDLLPETAARVGGFLRISMEDKAPGATFGLHMGGFDQDPRNLWDIPEAAAYIVAVARAAGIADWRSPLVPRFDKPTLAVLVLCGALGADHPFTVNIEPGPAHVGT